MNPAVIVRKNRLFCIDEAVLPAAANRAPIKGALYAAIHEEFKGAALSEHYGRLTPEQRMAKINDYAWKWLKDRGFE
jgi:hypothetical protein